MWNKISVLLVVEHLFRLFFILPQAWATPFSGVYIPDLEHAFEVYAGAWLAPRERFIASRAEFKRIDALEAASFSMVQDKLTYMTRDYFDFQVQHLSSTTNQLPDKTNQRFLAALKKKMIKNVEALKGHMLQNQDTDWRLMNKTVVLIPFSTLTASSDLDYDSFQMAIRHLFFEATFWSVYRYMPMICATVASKNDLETLKSLKLPLWKIVDMSALFDPKAKIRKPGSSHYLPKESLLYLVNKFEDKAKPKPWNQFEYIYFTEGDHILHLRSASHLMDLLEANKATVALAPHRLQTIALPKAFPQFQDQWKEQRIGALSSIDLVTEHEALPEGSCCDNGRFIFKECKNWWYNCPNWGLQNYTQWVRFGKHGFTMPFGTEHKARCTYTPAKRLCDIPPSCTSRMPSSTHRVCGEIPNVERTYGLLAST